MLNVTYVPSGPYAFMDIFDRWHICNHSDEEGRYSYKASITLVYRFSAF